jgi:hypothetical protein
VRTGWFFFVHRPCVMAGMATLLIWIRTSVSETAKSFSAADERLIAGSQTIGALGLHFTLIQR